MEEISIVPTAYSWNICQPMKQSSNVTVLNHKWPINQWRHFPHNFWETSCSFELISKSKTQMPTLWFFLRRVADDFTQAKLLSVYLFLLKKKTPTSSILLKARSTSNGKQQWHSSKNPHLRPMWPNFDASSVPYVGWVCWFLPCSEGFSPVFLPSAKTNIFKFPFSQDIGPAWKPAKVKDIDIPSSLKGLKLSLVNSN